MPASQHVLSCLKASYLQFSRVRLTSVTGHKLDRHKSDNGRGMYTIEDIFMNTNIDFK